MTVWIPDDLELDVLAREVRASPLSVDRTEQARTSVLARSVGTSAMSPRAPRTLWIGIGVAAAAAAVVTWFVVHPTADVVVARAPSKIFDVHGIGEATMQMPMPWPADRLVLERGTIAVELANLGSGEHLQIASADGSVDARDVTMEVTASAKRLAKVVVTRGRAEVHIGTELVVVLAGQSWLAPVTVEREIVPIEPTPKRVEVVVAPKPRVVKTLTPRAPPSRPAVTAELPAQLPPAAKPGEAEFRAGIVALRTGDATLATRELTKACTLARTDALDEDACFWAGAAARRANDAGTARAMLTDFLARFPLSTRAHEASALLGWILYDAGELDAAESRFRAAVGDRSDAIRSSAQRGLTAISRRR